MSASSAHCVPKKMFQSVTHNTQQSPGIGSAPIELAVMAICAYWLQETPWLQAASGDIATIQLLGMDVGRGMLDIVLARNEKHNHTKSYHNPTTLQENLP